MPNTKNTHCERIPLFPGSPIIALPTRDELDPRPGTRGIVLCIVHDGEATLYACDFENFPHGHTLDGLILSTTGWWMDRSSIRPATP